MDKLVIYASFFENSLKISASEAISRDGNTIIALARQVDSMWIKNDGVGITVKRVTEISTGKGEWG